MRAGGRQARRGFTLVELTVVGFLMGLFAVLLGNAWAAFGRPAISALARCRVAQEANLAAEAIARDVGLLAAPPGTPPDSRYANAQADGPTLYLTVDDGTGPARVITYGRDAADPSKLVRTDLSPTAGPARVVATLVADFEATRDTLPESGATGVRVDLTFTHRTHEQDPDGSFRPDMTRRYTLFIPDPQPPS